MQFAIFFVYSVVTVNAWVVTTEPSSSHNNHRFQQQQQREQQEQQLASITQTCQATTTTLFSTTESTESGSSSDMNTPAAVASDLFPSRRDDHQQQTSDTTVAAVAAATAAVATTAVVDAKDTLAVFTNSFANLDESNRPAFLEHCSVLCAQRNLPLQKVKNARDLASVRNSPIQPGRVFRMGRVSDATEVDIDLLFSDNAIRTLIDTRSPTELKDDLTLMREQVFSNFTSLVYKEQGRAKEGCVLELPSGTSPVKYREKKRNKDKKDGEGKRRHFWQSKKNGAIAEIKEKDQDIEEALDNLSVPSTTSYDQDYEIASIDDDDDDDEEEDEPCSIDCSESEVLQNSANRQERHFVSLMNEWKYVKGTVSKVRKRDLTKAVLKSPGALVSKRVRTSVKDTFVDKINDGGLPMLNELLLRFGAPGIRYTLTIVADKSRHPVAFYCTAGKDRTGILTAIILAICGVELEDIVEDYALSANVYAEMNDHQAMVGALSQRNLDPATFLTAPPQVMRDTMRIINEKYGSIEEYCNWIGFGADQQEQLRQACCDKE